MSDTNNEPADPSVIKRRSLSGVRWTTLQTAVVALLGPLAQVVRARFLSPSELGAVAVFMIVYGFVRTIENAGLAQSIVQKDDLSPGERFTFLVFGIALGLAGTLAVVILSNPIARVLGVPGAETLLIVGAPLLLVAVSDQYFRALLERNLRFRGPAVVETLKRFLSVCLLLILFVMGMGPVAVVISLMISTILGGLALFVLAARAKVIMWELKFTRSAASHLWEFGAPVAMKQIFTYFTHRADEIVVAVALTPEVLGIYHLAKETLDKLRGLITHSFSRVLLSLFSRIRDDRQRLTRTYQRVSVVVSYVGMSVFVGMALVAPDVVPAIFGQEWMDAVYSFQVLSIAAIPIVLTANLSSSLLYALGKSRHVLVADIAINVPYLLLLLLLRNQGLPAILFCYTGYCFAKGITLQVLSNKSLLMTASQHIYGYLRVLLRVSVMTVTVLVLYYLIPDSWAAGLRAVALVSVGVLVMMAAAWLTDKPFVGELLMLFKPTRSGERYAH